MMDPNQLASTAKARDRCVSATAPFGLDEAKAAFRRSRDGYGAFEHACGRSPRSNEEFEQWLAKQPEGEAH